MRMLTSIAVALMVSTAMTAGGFAQDQPANHPMSFNQEQLEVYRSLLDKLGPTLHAKNLAGASVPLDFTGFPESRPCLTGVELEGLSKTTHEFGPEIAKERGLRLVDRHEQLKLLGKERGSNADLYFLILSEIAFDKNHRFAVLRYLLVCGDHCDSGATLVMERLEGKWTVSSRRPCATFVNNSWSELPD